MLNPTTFVCAGGKSAEYSKGDGANFTCTLQGMTANYDVYTVTPIANPFGFASLPDKNSYAIVHLPGVYGQTPVVTGFVGTVSADSPLDVQLGETALFNAFKYTFEVKKTEIRARFHEISCKITNGDSAAQISLDLLNEMLSLVDFLNNYWTTIYNIHTHVVGGSSGGSIEITIPPLNINTISLNVVAPNGGGVCAVSGATLSTAITLAFPPAPPTPPYLPTTPPAPLANPYVLENPIETDAAYLEEKKGFIDDNGAIL